MKFVTPFIIFLLFVSCKKEVQTTTVLQGNAFGTSYTIQFFNAESLVSEKGIDSVIYVVNKSVSTYQANSDISKINKGNTSIVIDKIFRDNFNISAEVYKKSNGYFDPTIGVLRNAYGFGDTKPLQNIDKHVLDSLLQYVGFNKVSITSEGKIKKKHSQIYFDFNAVAKGYGIDCLGNYLEDKGVSNYLIELGGEILAKGKNLEKNKAWIVGIETIESQLENRSYAETVLLQDMGMASSGNYRKFRIDSVTGKKYVHTINPITGKAEESDVTSATVLAPTCAVADAYATAFMASGIERSKKMVQNIPDIEAYITFINTEGNPDVFITEGFQKFLQN